MERVTSVSLIDMPKKPTVHIQKMAPGPPRAMASATPPMLPRPTVAESAADNAWKWLIAPGSSGSSYLPRTTWKPWVRARYWLNRLQIVNTTPVPSRMNSTLSCQMMRLSRVRNPVNPSIFFSLSARFENGGDAHAARRAHAH